MKNFLLSDITKSLTPTVRKLVGKFSALEVFKVCRISLYTGYQVTELNDVGLVQQCTALGKMYDSAKSLNITQRTCNRTVSLV